MEFEIVAFAGTSLEVLPSSGHSVKLLKSIDTLNFIFLIGREGRRKKQCLINISVYLERLKELEYLIIYL